MPYESVILAQEPSAQSAKTKHEHREEKSNENDIDATEVSSNKNNVDPKLQVNGRHIHGLRWLVICVPLYISCIFYGLDTTIAADVQGSIIEQFGHVEQLTWVGAGFPLGSVCVILPLGNLYNIFNIKWIIFTTVVLFEAGSALCGADPTMSVLIVGRVIAGAGGSGIYLGSLNYFLAMTTPEERGLYMALIGSCWGVGAILGPVIGVAFATSSATWRWAFCINLVIFAIRLPPMSSVFHRSVFARCQFTLKGRPSRLCRFYPWRRRLGCFSVSTVDGRWPMGLGRWKSHRHSGGFWSHFGCILYPAVLRHLHNRSSPCISCPFVA